MTRKEITNLKWNQSNYSHTTSTNGIVEEMHFRNHSTFFYLDDSIRSIFCSESSITSKEVFEKMVVFQIEQVHRHCKSMTRCQQSKPYKKTKLTISITLSEITLVTRCHSNNIFCTMSVYCTVWHESFAQLIWYFMELFTVLHLIFHWLGKKEYLEVKASKWFVCNVLFGLNY